MTFQPMASISDEPIVVIVSGNDFQGGVVVASSATAEMAVVAPDTHPTSPDWNSTTWKTDATTSPATYRALGPSALDLSLVQGSEYVVWMRLTDTAGVTIKPVAGLLSIV